MKRQIVVITGASVGPRWATASEFGWHGARVGLLARGVDGLEAAKREIGGLAGGAPVMPTDVSDASAVERAAATVGKNLDPSIS